MMPQKRKRKPNDIDGEKRVSKSRIKKEQEFQKRRYCRRREIVNQKRGNKPNCFSQIWEKLPKRENQKSLLYKWTIKIRIKKRRSTYLLLLMILMVCLLEISRKKRRSKDITSRGRTSRVCIYLVTLGLKTFREYNAQPEELIIRR